MQFQLTEEQVAFQDTVRRFARAKLAPYAAAIDESPEFPWDLYRALGAQGLLGLTVPEDMGGSGAGVLEACLAAEELGRVSASFAPRVGVSTMIAESILLGGTEEQRARWVKPIVAGDLLPAIALTEPESGSDALSLTTTAVEHGGGWRINGTKRFITNADIADVILLVARLGEGGADGFGTFLVEKGSAGLEFTSVYSKMAGAALHACEVVLDGVEVPSGALLGEAPLPAGFIHAMSKGRLIVTAVATGLAAEATEVATRYATERRQFGRPIIKFQGVSFMLADMAIRTEAARSLLYRAASVYRDDEVLGTALASMAKCFATDVAMQVTTDAVQVLGGSGYTREFPVERMMREAKLLQIYEGTNQVQRVLVARHLESALE